MVSAKRPARKARTSYHHGSLRAALIDAALAQVERGGADSVSLKAIAAALGVSSPAPYRHFVDRNALLAAVAVEGFRSFKTALEVTGDDLEKMAQAYVAFGREHDGLYRLMFVSTVVKTAAGDVELREAAASAFDLLRGSVGRAVPKANSRLLAFSVWASLHGLVMLEGAGFTQAPVAVGLDPRDLVRAACGLPTTSP